MSYSTDLRERIVDTVLNKGMTLQMTAETFLVSKSSVERYLRSYRQLGDPTPQNLPGPPQRPTLAPGMGRAEPDQ